MTTKRLKSVGEWLPSRFRFAIFRLVGYIVLSGKEPVPNVGDETLLLAPAREQTRLETYSTMVVTFVVSVMFMLEVLAPLPGDAWRQMPWAILLAVFAWHGLLFSAGFLESVFRRLGLTGNVAALEIVTAMHLIAVTIAAAWLSRQNSPWRWVGIAWLTLLVLNLVAAVILRFLRDRLDALEQRWKESLFEAQS